MRLLWEVSTSSKTQLKINLKKATLKYELQATIPSTFVFKMEESFILEENLEPNSSIMMEFKETTNSENFCW